MSVRRLDPAQPADFAFTPENEAWALETIAKYPEGKQASAVIALLWRAQEQSGGWLPEPAIRYIADKLGMAHIRVLEVATFYTMFQLSPVGKKAHIQVCGTTPCMLRGSEALIEACKRRINQSAHKISQDGDFSWEEVECLGACVNAPLIQVGNKLYEDLTPDTLNDVLDAFARGETPEPGPRIERDHSAPMGGATTLNTPGFYEELAQRFAGDSQGVAAARDDAEALAQDVKVTAGAAQAAGRAQSRGAGGDGAGDSTGALDEAALAAEQAEIDQVLAKLSSDATPEQKADAVGARPSGLAAPRGGKADDLKRIKGIGPVNEKKLNALGIYHFDQIVVW